MHFITALRSIAATCGAFGRAAVNAARSGGGESVVLNPGDLAPDFSLPGSDGRTYRLVDFAGRVVVLAWFPRAFTGG